MGTDNQSTHAQSYGYRASYAYDPNGNILELNRHNQNGTTFDSLQYKYDDANPGQPIRNRLLHLHDHIPAATATTDIDDHSGTVDKVNYANNNYQYDAIGNLIRDDAENITNITWNVNGKIAKIEKTGGDEITFHYNATGNRIAKYVTLSGTTTATIYVRDAQGNVMATYTHSSAEGLKLTEQHLYGSDRLGVLKAPIDIPANPYSIWESPTYKGERTHEFRISNGQSYQSVQLTSNNNTRLYVIEALAGDVRVQQSSPGFNYLYGNAGTTQNMRVVSAGKKLAFTATRADLLVDGHFLITCEEDFDVSSFTGDARMVDHLHADQIFGHKHYELKNHLGNVLSTLSDRKYYKEDTTESTLFHSTFKPENLDDWQPMAGVEPQFIDGMLQVTAPEPGMGITKTQSNINENCTFEFCLDILNFDGSPVQLVILDQNGEPLLNEPLEEPGLQYCFALEGLEGVEELQFQIISRDGGSFLIDNPTLHSTCTQGVQVANVMSTQDYYPFGMVMPGRSYQGSEGYRYGFNGYENDNEIKGESNSIDYIARMYDPRLGRFLSIDPLSDQFPYYSLYQFAGNKPIIAIDLLGLQPEFMITKTGKLTQPVISVLNAAFSYDKEVLGASTWSYFKDTKSGKVWFFITGHPTASVSGQSVYHDAKGHSDAEWMGLIAHEESHRQDIHHMGNFNFYARYLVEGSHKDYRDISTERKAYDYGSDRYTTDLTDKLLSFKGGAVLDILGNEELGDREKAGQLRTIGLEFRLEEIINPALAQIKSDISNLEAQMESFSGHPDDFKAMETQLAILKIGQSFLEGQKNEIEQEIN